NRNPLLPIDFRTRNSSFFALGGRLGLASLGGGWSFSLQADNITNTLINVASLEISGLADNFAGVPEPGRVIFGQLRYQF
ncbi:MAG: hypothetical protein ACREQ9_14230, partial [Candidatus Binatia bacterium]